MKTRILSVLALLTASVFTLAAADVTGKWTAEMPGRDGNTQTSTFDLKADGSTLTGTVAGGRGGEQPIMNGKVDGSNIMFSVTRKMQDNEIKVNYKGVMSGDTIKFTSEVEGRDRKQEFTAKRSAT